MSSEFPGAVPEIPVTDIVAAAAYYQKAFGFTLDWGGEELGLAGISRGSCRMFLANQHYRERYGNRAPTLTWLNLDSREDVDALYRAWSAADARLLSAPESKPWGLHEFTAADLDGNLFRVFHDFATPERERGAEATLAEFIAKFEPAHRSLIGDVRDALRRRFPAAHELVYDNYNFFVIGYSATLRPSDAALSIAASAKGVSLCLIHGAALADPAGLLHGAGKQTRFLRVSSSVDLDRPEVAALLTAAATSAPVPLRDGPPGTLVIRSVSAKQRPRRRAPRE